MKWGLGLAATVAALGVVHAACAEPYVDYTPKKGVWQVVAIAVDPNHVDEYLVGLKTELVPSLEAAKAHGVIDQYGFMVKFNSTSPDANVLILRHYPSLSNLDPDRVRDEAMEKEVRAKLQKADQDKKIAEFEKYRRFVSDEYWVDVDLNK